LHKFIESDSFGLIALQERAEKTVFPQLKFLKV